MLFLLHIHTWIPFSYFFLHFSPFKCNNCFFSLLRFFFYSFVFCCELQLRIYMHPCCTRYTKQVKQNKQMNRRTTSETREKELTCGTSPAVSLQTLFSLPFRWNFRRKNNSQPSFKFHQLFSTLIYFLVRIFTHFKIEQKNHVEIGMLQGCIPVHFLLFLHYAHFFLVASD